MNLPDNYSEIINNKELELIQLTTAQQIIDSNTNQIDTTQKQQIIDSDIKQIEGSSLYAIPSPFSQSTIDNLYNLYTNKELALEHIKLIMELENIPLIIFRAYTPDFNDGDPCTRSYSFIETNQGFSELAERYIFIYKNKIICEYEENFEDNFDSEYYFEERYDFEDLNFNKDLNPIYLLDSSLHLETLSESNELPRLTFRKIITSLGLENKIVNLKNSEEVNWKKTRELLKINDKPKYPNSFRLLSYLLDTLENSRDIQGFIRLKEENEENEENSEDLRSNEDQKSLSNPKAEIGEINKDIYLDNSYKQFTDYKSFKNLVIKVEEIEL